MANVGKHWRLKGAPTILLIALCWIKFDDLDLQEREGERKCPWISQMSNHKLVTRF